MIFINQSNAIDLIAKIEGEIWKQDQLIQTDIHSFFYQLNKWNRFEEETILSNVLNIETILKNYKSDSIHGQSAIHRYFVIGNGELVFSRYYANVAITKYAEKLGFKIETLKG